MPCALEVTQRINLLGDCPGALEHGLNVLRAGSVACDLLRKNVQTLPGEVPELTEIGVLLNGPVEFCENKLGNSFE